MKNQMTFQLTLGFSDPIRNKEEVARNVVNGLLNQAMGIGLTAEDDDGITTDIAIGSAEGQPLVEAKIGPHGADLSPVSLSEKEITGFIQREALRQVSHGLATIAGQMDSDSKFYEWIQNTPFFDFFTECIDEVSRKIMHIIPEVDSNEGGVSDPGPNEEEENAQGIGMIFDQLKKEVQPVLVSKTGLVNEPNYYVFFYPARQLEKELAKFLKVETGLDLTVCLAADEYGDLSLNIKEDNDLIMMDGEEMTVTEYLDNRHNYSFFYCCESQTARDVAARFFDLHVNDLSHLQYFEDEDDPAKSQIRMSIQVSALQGDGDEETIGASYIACRAVSNMLYFLIKAADQEINLSLTYPRCTIFEDAVGGSLLEWVDDFEKKVTNGDPVIRAIEELLKEELVEGTYLTDGSESYLKKLQETLAPGNDNSKQLVIYQILERLVMEAEEIRNKRDKE